MLPPIKEFGKLYLQDCLKTNSLWKFLNFSHAKVFKEICKNFDQTWQFALMWENQLRSLDYLEGRVAAPQTRDTLATLVHKAFDGLFIYQPLIAKKQISKLGIKYGWSKERVCYPGVEMSGHDLISFQNKINNQIKECEERCRALFADDVQFPVDALLRQITFEDVFGKKALYDVWVQEKSPKSQIHKILKEIVSPVTLGSKRDICASSGSLMLQNTWEISMVPQLSYEYVIFNGQQVVFRGGTETLFGIGSPHWDDITSTKLSEFQKCYTENHKRWLALFASLN